MSYNTYSHTRISGISVVVPKHEIRLEDELEYFGGSMKKVERVKALIGLAARRVADEGVTAADLCQQAAENLFEGMQVARDSVDALIFISQGPDHAVPATGCILQDKLGLAKTCAAFDVNQGCTAYVYGLWLASSLIDSRACTRVLLLVGEAGARATDPANRVVSPIFGDCGTATLVEYSADETPSWYLLGTDGSGAEALMVPAGHSRFHLPTDGKEYEEFLRPIRDALGNPWYLNSTFMDGAEIFNFTMDVVPDHLKECMARSGNPPDTLDWVVLHQANKQIANAIATKAGIPLQKAPTETVTKYGNQAGASVPAVIADQLAEEVRNGRIKVLLSGYGVGLSWASAVLFLDHIWCSGIREYETPDDLPTQQELKEKWMTKMRTYGAREEDTK